MQFAENSTAPGTPPQELSTNASPHLEPTRRALAYLHDRGAHFVLLTGKRPLWRGYMRRRPALEAVIYHADLGIVPWSLRTSALDVDEGQPDELCECCPPVVSLETRRGWHCYYRDTAPRGNANFTLLGASGQVRGSRGYLKLWNDGPVNLLHALLHNPEPCLFPADLLTTKPTKHIKPADPGEPYTRRISRREIDLFNVMPGFRNTALFDAVRYFSYSTEKPSSMHDWQEQVRIHANTRNIQFRQPLPVREVDRLALSISTWVWSGGGPSRHKTWTPEQQRLGGQTRKRMQRYDNLKRDEGIRQAVQNGVSMRATAREFELALCTVQNILKRG